LPQACRELIDPLTVFFNALFALIGKRVHLLVFVFARAYVALVLKELQCRVDRCRTRRAAVLVFDSFDDFVAVAGLFL
jgi:hypothetical protein